MRPHIVVALLFVFFSHIQAGTYTRFVFNNSLCEGEYRGFRFYPDLQQPCDTSCVEIGAGYWRKEDCNPANTVPAQNNLNLAVSYNDAGCSVATVYTGGLPDQCFAYDNEGGITAYKISKCLDGSFTFSAHIDASCTPASEVGSISVSATCTADANFNNVYYNTYSCGGGPVTAPVAQPVAGPVSSSNPVSSPTTGNAPNSGTTPSVSGPTATPGASNQPASSPKGKVAAASTVSGSIAISIGSLLVAVVAL